MKFILALCLSLLSFSALASWNEVECEGYVNGNKFVMLEIEQPFPNSSVFKRATLVVSSEGAQSYTTYTVTTRNLLGFGRIEYNAPDFRLEVDIWPDNYPRWGMMYRSTFRSSVLGNNPFNTLTCRFPNAF